MKNTFLAKLLNRIDRVGQGDLQAYRQRLHQKNRLFGKGSFGKSAPASFSLCSWIGLIALSALSTGLVNAALPNDSGPGPYLDNKFSFNGKQLLIGGSLWDVQTGKELRHLDLEQNLVVFSTRFSPDGRSALTSTARQPWLVAGPVILWNVATGEEIVRFVPSDGFVFDTQFSPDGKRLLAALTGTQHNRDTVQIWDAHTGQRLLVLQGMNPPASGPPANLYVSFSPDGRRILMLSNYEVSIRDSMTGELICKMETPEETRQPHFFVSTQFSPDGKLVLTEQCNGICRIWNAVTGAQLQTFATVKPSGSDQPYAQPCALFTPDGRGVISGSDEGTAHLWDVGSGKEIRRFHLPGGKGVVTQMIISRDGKRLITVCAEMRSRNTGGSGVFVWDVVWDVELGRVITQLSGDFERLGGERLVGFSPTNEKFITVKDEKPAALWDGATGKIIKRYQPQN